MEESNLRTVRVYTKKYSSKDKDGNVIEKESKQKQVSLKKDDPFEDNELVVVLKEKEYKDLLANNRKDFEDIITEKDNEIAHLNNQLSTLKSSFFDDIASFKDQLDEKEELLKAKDEIDKLNKKLVKVNDERIAIFKELDYKNKMILAYNVELNFKSY